MATTQFSDLKIKVEQKAFIGDKIKMKKILTHEIEVHGFKIGPSKFDGVRMDLQISLQGIKHVVFTTSKYLQEAIHLVPKDKFPFSTRIIEIDDRFEFT